MRGLFVIGREFTEEGFCVMAVHNEYASLETPRWRAFSARSTIGAYTTNTWAQKKLDPQAWKKDDAMLTSIMYVA